MKEAVGFTAQVRVLANEVRLKIRDIDEIATKKGVLETSNIKSIKDVYVVYPNFYQSYKHGVGQTANRDFKDTNWIFASENVRTCSKNGRKI